MAHFNSSIIDAPNFLNRKRFTVIFVLLVFLPIFFYAFVLYSSKLPGTFQNLREILFFEDLKTGTFGFLIGKFLVFLTILAPYFFVTLLETFRAFENNAISIYDLSFLRIKISEGSKFADLWYFVLSQFFNRISFLTVFITIGFSQINSELRNWFDSLYTSIVPVPSSEIFAVLILLIALITNDFLEYWRHRLAHRIPFIWDLHEFHHSATQMTMLSESRHTPLERVFIDPISIPIGVFTGLLINQILLKGFKVAFCIYLIDATVGFFTSYLGHSSLKIIFPKPFSFIFMSPAHHWLHHSINPAHYDCNFSEKYVFFDKIFGTFLDLENIKDIQGFGVKDTEYNKYHPLYSYAILPINKLFRRVRFLYS